jgi:hypothetical protein
MITTVTVMWRSSDKAICFLKQRFHIILLDTSCENHQNGYKNMARFTKIWREVFKKYYKACGLLFKENIPFGRPWPSIKI